MADLRKAAVAGAFYPLNPDSLNKQIEEFVSQAPVDNSYKDTFGIIVPHAGYIYSGQCAAYGYKALSQKKFTRAVLIAPSHRFAGFRFSVGNYDYYQTPLGKIEVDKEYSEQLLEDKNFDFILQAHRNEHALEVQLPFLQFINKKVKIVPIVFGAQNYSNSLILSKILTNLFSDKLDETVFVISSDLSHYYDSDIAKKKDGKLADYLKQRDVTKLKENFAAKSIEACGEGGILTLLEMANSLNIKNIRNLKYMHSGEINHDYSQVVGYISTVFYN